MLNYIELIKPRLSATVIFSSLAGYFLAINGQIDITILIKLLFGGVCLVGASNGLNQVYEVNIDALMDRTKNRPLPTRRISVVSAFIFSLLIGFIGVLFLFSINARCAFFGALSAFVYVLMYTPLKTVSPISGFIGAFPGATPFMLGWVAVTDKFGLETVLLFAIQFLWQFPHFWSIAWVRYEDYQKAGINLLPSGFRDHKSAFQIVFYTFCLIPISVAPKLLSYINWNSRLNLSMLGVLLILVLGTTFFHQSLCLLKTKKTQDAKKLMKYSLIYLPMIQIIYILDKYI
tara:strand:+ start:1105 stop:1971 length:867 start_codon:yes stop_codon:yes gene_type:complete